MKKKKKKRLCFNFVYVLLFISAASYGSPCLCVCVSTLNCIDILSRALIAHVVWLCLCDGMRCVRDVHNSIRSIFTTQHSFCYSFALVFISLSLSLFLVHPSNFDFIDCTNLHTHRVLTVYYTYIRLLLLLLLLRIALASSLRLRNSIYPPLFGSILILFRLHSHCSRQSKSMKSLWSCVLFCVPRSVCVYLFAPAAAADAVHCISHTIRLSRCYVVAHMAYGSLDIISIYENTPKKKTTGPRRRQQTQSHTHSQYPNTLYY